MTSAREDGAGGGGGQEPPPGRPARAPGVYARLAEEAEVRLATRTPRPFVRVLGWCLCLALAGGVLWAVGSSPW